MEFKRAATALFYATLAAPFLVSAAFPTQAPSSALSQKGSAGLGDLLVKSGNWFFGIILGLAVIFILYAAYNFLISGGDEEKVGAARQYLTYAVIAIAVAVLSMGIVYLVRVFLGDASVPPPTPPGGGEMCTTVSGMEIFCPAPMRCENNLCVSP